MLPVKSRQTDSAKWLSALSLNHRTFDILVDAHHEKHFFMGENICSWSRRRLWEDDRPLIVHVILICWELSQHICANLVCFAELHSDWINSPSCWKENVNGLARPKSATIQFQHFAMFDLKIVVHMRFANLNCKIIIWQQIRRDHADWLQLRFKTCFHFVSWCQFSCIISCLKCMSHVKVEAAACQWINHGLSKSFVWLCSVMWHNSIKLLHTLSRSNLLVAAIIKQTHKFVLLSLAFG